MMDLIDRKKILDFCRQIIDRDDSGENIIAEAFKAFAEYVKVLPSAQSVDKDIHVPCNDLISRQAFRSRIETEYRRWGEEYDAYQVLSDLDDFPSAQPDLSEYSDKLWRNAYERGKAEAEQRWIPCTPDTMPEDLGEVYVTWVNHNPPWYYTEIKDKPFTAPAVYHRGKWYWYSSVCVDTLAEYGKNAVDEVDKDIEIVAWCKMPEAYGGEQE